MAVIPSTYGQVNFHFSGTFLPTGAETTFGFSNNAGSEAVEAAHFFRDTLHDAGVVSAFSTALICDKVSVKLGPNDVGAAAEWIEPFGGTILQNPESANVCVLVRKITALGGRRNRGRSFWPGLGETDTDDSGHIVNTRLTELNTHFTTFLDDCNDGGHTLVLLHSPKWAAESPVELTQLSVDSLPATQRRRLRR